MPVTMDGDVGGLGCAGAAEGVLVGRACAAAQGPQPASAATPRAAPAGAEQERPVRHPGVAKNPRARLNFAVDAELGEVSVAVCRGEVRFGPVRSG
jgi:hypothetical protein